LAEAYLLDIEDDYQLPRNIKRSIELLRQVLDKQPDNIKASVTLAKALEK
jgi:uncharacterized protein (UPF0147 family)